MSNSRIHLSIPHMSGAELEFIHEAFETNWIAPLGPNVDAFEKEFADAVGSKAALAVSSGTAAIHLALRVTGVGPGDEVWVSTLTFAASVNPVLYEGATPVFVDSDTHSWNMDPELFVDALGQRAKVGRLPKAVVLVHLYGQSADIDPISEACRRYDVILIEDAAEALANHWSYEEFLVQVLQTEAEQRKENQRKRRIKSGQVSPAENTGYL